MVSHVNRLGAGDKTSRRTSDQPHRTPELDSDVGVCCATIGAWVFFLFAPRKLLEATPMPSWDPDMGQVRDD